MIQNEKYYVFYLYDKYGLISFKEADQILSLCENQIKVAEEFIRLKQNTVCCKKIIEGKKISFTEEDYLALAKETVRKQQEALTYER